LLLCALKHILPGLFFILGMQHGDFKRQGKREFFPLFWQKHAPMRVENITD